MNPFAQDPQSADDPQDRIEPPLPPPGLYVVPDLDAAEAVPLTPDSVDVPASDGEVQSFTLVDGQVDSEALVELTAPHVSDRQVIPDWVKDREQVLTAANDAVVRVWRVVAFHLVRVPKYVARLVGLSPYGLWRAARVWAEWVRDAEYSDDRVLLRSNGGDVHKLKEAHQSKVSQRVLTSFGFGLAALVAVLLLVSAMHPLSVAMLALAGLCVLGWVGAPVADKPVIERASYRIHKAPPFTESLMLSALRQCGAEPKEARPVQVVQPPAKIRSGWEAVVSVGVEAAAIIERRSRFATVVDRPENCVWLSSDPEEAAGWLRIVITRKSLRRARIPAWPFLHGGSFNWFTDEVPIGIDETGQPVAASKAYRSTVCGGMMGAGKTVAMINSGLGQAVDPRVELRIYDLKGGTDWEPLAPIAHVVISGSDSQDHKAVIADLKAQNQRMDRRYETLKTLPAELKSPKTNDRLASMRHLDLHPIVIIIDETQELFELADDARLYYALVSRLTKKGRAVGISIEGGTQEVTKKTLPIAGLCHWRHCLSVQGHGAVDLVLGTGAYKAGFNADALTAEDVGIGYFGSGKEMSVVKSYYIDPDNGDLDNVVARLKQQRQALGLLTGMAAGDTPQDDVAESTLERVARVWPEGTTKLQWVELVDLLHAAMPDDYPKVTTLNNGVPPSVAKAVDALSAQLGRHSITARDVRSKFAPKKGQTSSVRKGIWWADISQAVNHDDQTNLDTESDIDLDSDDEFDVDTVHFDEVDIDDDGEESEGSNIDSGFDAGEFGAGA